MIEWLHGHCLSGMEALRQEPGIWKDRRLAVCLIRRRRESARLPLIASLLCVGVPAGKMGDEAE